MTDRITQADLQELKDQLNALTSVQYIIRYSGGKCGLYAYRPGTGSTYDVCTYQTKSSLYAWLRAYIAGIEAGLAEAKRRLTQRLDQLEEELPTLDTSNIAYSPAVWDADQQQWLYGQEADNYRDTHPGRYGD